MSIFNPLTRSNDPHLKSMATQVVNGTGAAITRGQVVAYQPSTQQAVAVTSARTGWILLVALEDVAASARGRFATHGQVDAQVTDGLAADSRLMPNPVVSGGTTLVAYASNSTATNVACAQNIATGAGTTPVAVLFDGQAGRPFGYNAAS